MVNGITSPYTLPVKWLHSQYLLCLEEVVSSFLAVQDEAPLLVPLLQPQDTELKEKMLFSSITVQTFTWML